MDAPAPGDSRAAARVSRRRARWRQPGGGASVSKKIILVEIIIITARLYFYRPPVFSKNIF
jgi:hypothetical protein